MRTRDRRVTRLNQNADGTRQNGRRRQTDQDGDRAGAIWTTVDRRARRAISISSSGASPSSPTTGGASSRSAIRARELATSGIAAAAPAGDGRSPARAGQRAGRAGGDILGPGRADHREEAGGRCSSAQGSRRSTRSGSRSTRPSTRRSPPSPAARRTSWSRSTRPATGTGEQLLRPAMVKVGDTTRTFSDA